MTQFAKPTLVATTDDGVTLAAKFNGALGALYSSHGGAAAPPSPGEGQPWLDTSGATATPPIVQFKVFQSGSWWTLGTLNLQTGVYTVSGALSSGGGSLTGPLLFPSGTAALPGFAFVGDENTGIWRPGGDTMELVVGAQGVLRLVPRATGLIQVNQGLDILGRTRLGWFAGQSSNAQLELNKAATANSAVITGMQSGVIHWTMELGDGTTGRSDFVLSAYNDAGVYQFSPLSIRRDNGQATFAGSVSVPNLEVYGSTFTYIDLKVPATDDWDMRISTGGAGGDISVQGGNLGLVNGSTWIAITPTHTQFSGVIRAERLSGGPQNAGALNSWNGANSVCFRWENDLLAFRIDEAVDRIICSAVNARDLEYAGNSGGPTGIALNGWDNGRVNLFGIHVDAISDARIKTNIRNTETDALAVINAVPVRSFSIKGDVVGHIRAIGLSPAQKAAMPPASDTPVGIGFIAQELMAHVPEAVTVRNQPAGTPLPPDTHSLVQQNLVPYLWRAIQQQQAVIASLESRIAALENA